MLKRTVLLLLSAVMVISLFTACTSDKTGKNHHIQYGCNPENH